MDTKALESEAVCAQFGVSVRGDHLALLLSAAQLGCERLMDQDQSTALKIAVLIAYYDCSAVRAANLHEKLGTIDEEVRTKIWKNITNRDQRASGG